MKILAMETGQKSCSAALMEDGRILAEEVDNRGMTHSQTAVDMVGRLLEAAGWSAKEIELYAVTVGPGSFTGLRIGISAVKGLCFDGPAKIAAVSSLEALAENYGGDGLIAPVIDARRDRVYGALFSCENGVLTRLMPDSLMEIDAFLSEIAGLCGKKSVFAVGDGANLCYNVKNKSCPLLQKPTRAEDPLRASSVGRVGLRLAQKGEVTDAEGLIPAYFQKPKAERMRERAGQEL